MTYVPGYQWDVFVSFANNDDDAARVEDRWVSRFVEELKIGIRTWLGDADKLKVFFQKDSTTANLQLSTLLDYARNSAIFIAVVSPSYVRRDWPLDELTAFCESGDTLGRLFAIECRPVGDYSFSINLRDIIALPFFIQDKDSRAPRPLSPDQDPRMWKNRIGELTHDIATRLQKFGPADGNLKGNGNSRGGRGERTWQRARWCVEAG
jgi:TIR domain